MDQEIPNRLSDAVSVRDVMTETEELRRADSSQDAEYLFHEYDVVPYPKRGDIEGFFRRNCESMSVLKVEDVISSDTRIVDLPGLLIQRPFYFVVSSNTVVGYLHYSDLNKVITKIPLFVLFQAAERRLWDKIEGRISEEDLGKVFDEGAAKKFSGMKKGAIEGNADVGWTGVFTLPSILRLARHYGLVDLTNDEIKLLKDTRNKVAHSDNLLVTHYGDVSSLAAASETLRSLIGGR